ncbi:MAG TPA: HAD-IC family P-type ATPase, partial [Dermatophilaceae bacterium]
MITSGLTDAEAAHRLVELGPNEIHQRSRVSVGSSIALQLRDPLIVVLLAACVLTLLTGDLPDTAVIALVVAVNTTVGVTQELRADRAVTALAELSAPSVRVRRGGRELQVPAGDLVCGDIVLLGEGDFVPADCEVLEATSVLVDEAAVTGESVPVGKGGPLDERVGDSLAAGTVVVKGRAVTVVTATGASSTLGRIAALMDTRVEPTPLQRRLAGLGRDLALVAVALSAVVLVSGLLRGEPVELMVVTAISLAVAAVPESLPAVVTFSLALGARHMAARNAIVRRLPAVETLGSVTVLATDKTGTLTSAQMVVAELWTLAGPVNVSGNDLTPVGELTSAGRPLDPIVAAEVVNVLRAGALCNDATLLSPAGDGEPWTGLGDPTEIAILVAAGKIGLTREGLERDHPRVGEVPFDSSNQQMLTLHARPGPGSARSTVYMKGSVEALHARAGTGPHSRVWPDALFEAAQLA